MRSVTVGYGRLWTLLPPAWHAGGVCVRQVPATDWMESRAFTEGAGLKVRRHRQDQERRSGVELGIRAFTCGVSSRAARPIA
jgi:hypothetical protein